MEILLVEDERVIRAHYVSILEGEGFSVRAAKDGAQALEEFARRRPDLAVLDLDLPKVAGFRVCEEFRRAAPSMPIVILTANASDANEVRALGLGADDFCAKTESAEVVLARVRRAAERTAALAPAGGMPKIVKLGQVEVDTATMVVSHGGGAERLTRGEMDVFTLLWEANGRMCRPEELLDAMRERGSPCDIAVLYVFISGLRRKLGPAGGLIDNRRRVGYRLIR